VNYKELLHQITTFMFDYDGVLTTGEIFILPDGEVLRGGYVRDGYAIQHAIKNGYRIVIISGGKSDSMVHRLNALKVNDFFLGIADKLSIFNEYIHLHHIEPQGVLYMGDDIPDLTVMQQVGLPCCPADASEEIKAISLYISHREGGKGCVRDVIEQVMKLQGKWMNGDAFYW
jgi:3-deoxy-D-manno-octulosonate 8-phosphate phosphatase (KDO 8-P phosphatase)